MTTKTEVWKYSCPLCYTDYEPEDKPMDGRCDKCEASPKLAEKQSEFGAGIVVCLVKFAEHLGDRRYRKIWEYKHYLKKPTGENPLGYEEESYGRYPTLARGKTPQEHAMHEAIHMWASAAGDHFFDLDRDKAPASLVELADLMIELRNSHLADEPRVFTTDDVERVLDLYQTSVVAIDQALGTVPNWGEY